MIEVDCPSCGDHGPHDLAREIDNGWVEAHCGGCGVVFGALGVDHGRR